MSIYDLITQQKKKKNQEDTFLGFINPIFKSPERANKYINYGAYFSGMAAIILFLTEFILRITNINLLEILDMDEFWAFGTSALITFAEIIKVPIPLMQLGFLDALIFSLFTYGILKKLKWVVILTMFYFTIGRIIIFINEPFFPIIEICYLIILKNTIKAIDYLNNYKANYS